MLENSISLYNDKFLDFKIKIFELYSNGINKKNNNTCAIVLGMYKVHIKNGDIEEWIKNIKQLIMENKKKRKKITRIKKHKRNVK